MQMREKVGKSRNTVFSQWFGAPEGRKVGSLKRRVRSQLARWEMKSCTPLWREAHFQVKMYKTPQRRTTFGSCDVEQVHAVVARSTFGSQNVKNTRGSDHFWKLRCRKSACRCGAKHISKSKCTKHTSSGPLLAVAMSKKCTPLWREAYFKVKMYKTHHSRTTFGGSQMSKKCTPLWREAHFEVKMLKTLGVRTTFGGSDVASLHSLHYITLHYTPLHYTTLHYTTLHNITTTTTQPHSTTLNYTTLHYTKITLHYTTLRYTPLHYTTLHYTTLPSTTLHYITLHYTTTTTTTTPTQLHSTTLHYTKFHYATLHYTTLHSTTLHYITLHSTTLQLQLHSTDR